jgi:Tfp pilus assembly protein PilW
MRQAAVSLTMGRMTPSDRCAGRMDRRAAAGFTLVELTVALLAGLIVAMGIVALSREATRTFHEEVRSSAAEATLRTAVDRLQADLQRAGYMSSANILDDPMLSAAPGASRVNKLPSTAPAPLKRLAGIHLSQGWSSTGNALSLSGQQTPALAPDMIEIAGNMTTAEQFEVMGYQPQSGNCTTLLLSGTSPAVLRILNNNTTTVGPDGGVVALSPSPSADTEMRNVFQPVAANATTQFLVRFVDDTGHTQYLLTCGVAQAAGIGSTFPMAPYLLIDVSKTPLLTAQQTGTIGGVNGQADAGGVVHGWVNPVQIVRWEITKASGATDNEPTQYAAASAGGDASGADPNKYDLMRSYYDVVNDRILPETSEVIAEYVVDLNFAFSVADATGTAITSYPFDSASNQAAADNVLTTTAQPQRIRSVRARVVTRTAQADRTLNVSFGGDSGLSFIYRYYLGPGQWARARTDVIEVSLPNQSRAFF